MTFLFSLIAIIMSSIGNSLRGATTEFWLWNGDNNTLIRVTHAIIITFATFLVLQPLGLGFIAQSLYSIIYGASFYIWNLFSWGAWMYMGEYFSKDENHEKLDRVPWMKPIWVVLWKLFGKPKDTVIPDFICMTIRNIYSGINVLIVSLVLMKTWLVIPLYLVFNLLMSMAYVIGHKVLYEDHAKGHKASELLSGAIQMLFVVIVVLL